MSAMGFETELTYTFTMPKGAQVELVKLSSGVVFPSYCWAEVDHPRTGLSGRYEFAVEDGEPVLRRFTVDAPPDVAFGLSGRSQPRQPPLSTQVIRTMSSRKVLDEIVARAAQVAARHGLTGGYEPKGEPYPRLESDERRRLAELGEQAVEGRRIWRAVTPQLLAEVREIVRANPDAPNKAVVLQLHTSKRNATRWIALAHKENGR